MLQHMIDVRKTYPDLKIRIIKQHCIGIMLYLNLLLREHITVNGKV